jgi:membrane-bound lytic murein transglycosylase B
LEPTYTWSDLKGFGAKARPSTFTDAWKLHPLGIVDLPDEPRNTLELRSGTPNFFAITHYNRSYFYAASVADLALAISRRINGAAPY